MFNDTFAVKIYRRKAAKTVIKKPIKFTWWRYCKNQVIHGSSKECSFFFLWRKGTFSSRNRPSRNLTLFSSRRSAWSVFKCNQGSEVFCWIFRYILQSMAKKITCLKGNLLIYKCFIDVSYIFSWALKKNYKMRPRRFEIDFVLNFAMCSADFTCELLRQFYLHGRIQDPDSVTWIALKG